METPRTVYTAAVVFAAFDFAATTGSATNIFGAGTTQSYRKVARMRFGQPKPSHGPSQRVYSRQPHCRSCGPGGPGAGKSQVKVFNAGVAGAKGGPELELEYRLLCWQKLRSLGMGKVGQS